MYRLREKIAMLPFWMGHWGSAKICCVRKWFEETCVIGQSPAIDFGVCSVLVNLDTTWSSLINMVKFICDLSFYPFLTEDFCMNKNLCWRTIFSHCKGWSVRKWGSFLIFFLSYIFCWKILNLCPFPLDCNAGKTICFATWDSSTLLGDSSYTFLFLLTCRTLPSSCILLPELQEDGTVPASFHPKEA